jgi:hypothetical protein
MRAVGESRRPVFHRFSPITAAQAVSRLFAGTADRLSDEAGDGCRDCGEAEGEKAASVGLDAGGFWLMSDGGN